MRNFWRAALLAVAGLSSFGATSALMAATVSSSPVQSTIYMFKALGLGYVNGTPNTTNGDWVQYGGNGAVGGNRTTDATPRATYIEAQSAWAQATSHTAGADLDLAAGLGRRLVALTSSNCSGNYVRFVIEGTTTTLTEGVDWQKGSSNTAAATSLTTAINTDIATVTATSSGGTVYIQRNQSTANGGAADMTLSTDDVTCAAITAGTNGTINVWSPISFKSTQTNTGSLEVDGNFTVNTNKFSVTASSGNTTIAGTCESDGNFSVATNKFTVAAASGNTVAAGTVESDGDFSVATNKFTVAAASGNTVVAGTLKGTASTLGWSYQSGANTACTTTCSGHGACVHGIETSAGEVEVVCTDATADKCLCTN